MKNLSFCQLLQGDLFGDSINTALIQMVEKQLQPFSFSPLGFAWAVERPFVASNPSYTLPSPGERYSMFLFIKRILSVSESEVRNKKYIRNVLWWKCFAWFCTEKHILSNRKCLPNQTRKRYRFSRCVKMTGYWNLLNTSSIQILSLGKYLYRSNHIWTKSQAIYLDETTNILCNHQAVNSNGGAWSNTWYVLNFCFFHTCNLISKTFRMRWVRLVTNGSGFNKLLKQKRQYYFMVRQPQVRNKYQMEC